MGELLDRPFWIFDMDGTLTVPQHDFTQFKVEHGLPADRDVLGGIRTLPVGRQAQVLAAVRAWERGLADRARPMADAVRLLDALQTAGAKLGILTRNSRSGAEHTLRSAGLDPYFPDHQVVLGRDCAEPKPSPAGVQRLLDHWGAPADQAVMVGDWLFDVQAGRAAGTATVLVARHGAVPPAWRPFADRVVDSLDELLDA